MRKSVHHVCVVALSIAIVLATVMLISWEFGAFE